MSKDVKLKKKHRFLATKIIVIFSTVFVIAPVATFMGLFYVADTKDVSSVTPENITTTLTNRLFRSIGELSNNNPELKLTFDDQTLDGLLMYVNQDVVSKTAASNYLPKFYCTINDNKYNFYADVRTNALKTRLEIDTTLDKDDVNELKFTIDNVKLGRLSISKNLIGNITSNFINDSTINDALENLGFRAKMSFKDLQLTYARDTFREDMDTYLKTATSENEELANMNAVFNMIGFDPDCIGTDYTNGLSVILNLTNFAKNVTIPCDLSLNLNNTNANALKIVNDNRFKLYDETKEIDLRDHYNSVDEITTDLVTFFNYGYDKVATTTNDEYAGPIQKLVSINNDLVKEKFDLKTDVSSYNNEAAKIVLPENSDVILTTDDITKLVGGTPVKLTPSKINNYLYNFKFIGKPFSLSLNTGDGYQNAYLALNNFCFDITDDGKINAYIGMDVNGLTMNTLISLDPSQISFVEGVFTLQISSGKDAIKIGSITVDEDTITQIASKFNKGTNFSFENGAFSIKFKDLEKYTISCKVDVQDKENKCIVLTKNS